MTDRHGLCVQRIDEKVTNLLKSSGHYVGVYAGEDGQGPKHFPHQLRRRVGRFPRTMGWRRCTACASMPALLTTTSG